MRYINKQRFVKAKHTKSSEVTNGIDGQYKKSAQLSGFRLAK